MTSKVELSKIMFPQFVVVLTQIKEFERLARGMPPTIIGATMSWEFLLPVDALHRAKWRMKCHAVYRLRIHPKTLPVEEVEGCPNSYNSLGGPARN